MQQDKYNRNKRQRNGFTLVEVLAALAVISVAMTPIFVQVNAAFRLSRVIKENLTATMLAQEGIELTRGIRDGNWFRGDSFEQGLDLCGGGCYMQYDDTVLTPGSGPPLQLDARGRYQYDSGTATPYSRTITVETVSPVHLRVTSDVTWNSRGMTRSIVLEDHLFDWLSP